VRIALTISSFATIDANWRQLAQGTRVNRWKYSKSDFGTAIKALFTSDKGDRESIDA